MSHKFKIGSRVVAVRKTVGRPFDFSIGVLGRMMEKKLKFMYVVKIRGRNFGVPEGTLTCNEDKNAPSGGLFRAF
jgi:hypothetical protein